MSMLRSLFVLLCSALAFAQSEPPKAFVHDFGAPGAVGSFRAKIAPAGGGLVFLQAADHFINLAAARKETKSGADYLLLAFNGADHALRLGLGAASASSSSFVVDPADARAIWTTTADGDRVTFTLDGGAGLVLEKVLRHDPRWRGFELEIALKNTGSTATGSLDFVLGGPALVVPHESGLFGTLSVAIAVPVVGDALHVVPAAGTVQRLAVDPAQLSFAGSTNRFFGAFLWPKDGAAQQVLRSFDVDTVPAYADTDTGMQPNTGTRVRYGMQLAIPAAGAETRVKFGLYFGPKSYRVFSTLPEPERFAPILDVDLNAPCCFSVTMPGGRPMAKLLLKVLGWFHDLVGNWGVAIMMLTILVRSLLAPLNFRMQKSMRAYSARMAVLKPKLDAIKQKHGDDKAAYQQAMVAFQREHKMLPPLGGCLPIFLTMPIYIGLFTALRTAYDVRQQPFFGWIEDLSRSDELFSLPFWPEQFNLLPILWIALMVVQMLRQPMPTDPQQRQQMQIMRFMPLIFGVMLYSYAAALLVYMVTSMLWTFVESAITKKILGPIDPNVAALTPQTF
jgi:YidC/Oxa1 family membrane protein insertase